MPGSSLSDGSKWQCYSDGLYVHAHSTTLPLSNTHNTKSKDHNGYHHHTHTLSISLVDAFHRLYTIITGYYIALMDQSLQFTDSDNPTIFNTSSNPHHHTTFVTNILPTTDCPFIIIDTSTIYNYPL